MLTNSQTQNYQDLVSLKYQLFNSLFLTLPFKNLHEAGVELPIFTDFCKKGLAEGHSPYEIVKQFFQSVYKIEDSDKQLQILLLFLQFIERQVVLIDALEDAAFLKTHDIRGTLLPLLKKAVESDRTELLKKILLDYGLRIVLTAHPTQFYPQQVLYIIQDLTSAIKKNRLKDIRNILLQMGKTPFQNIRKPSPLDEAEILIYYLENTFYTGIKTILEKFNTLSSDNHEFLELPDLIRLGFWPGGDRDGNPFVTVDITLKVAERLKQSIIQLYIKEIRKLKRRLTFKNIWNRLRYIEQRLLTTELSNDSQAIRPYHHYQEFHEDLLKIREILINEHQALFLDKLDTVISTANCFGFHFASLDLRQDSRVQKTTFQALLRNLLSHQKIPTEIASLCQDYKSMPISQKLGLLVQLANCELTKVDPELWPEDELSKDILGSIAAIKIVQQTNGEKGLHRYIISNTQSAAELVELLLMAHWVGWPAEKIPLDIVPLFETINDLNNSEQIIKQLYEHPLYKNHLKNRNNIQTIMLGFSDGTKDGGYVAANLTILQCKIKLMNLANQYGIKVLFFDGRGGPPARGGGNTHLFYHAMQSYLPQYEIQLTIQGQTVSSSFGTHDTASFNIEQLLTSGLEAQLLFEHETPLTQMDNELLQSLSDISLNKYQQLKNHPLFMEYLNEISTLSYFTDLKFASRPTSRNKSTLDFKNLRAIPYVSAWSQLKQNIPGFYGLGTALKQLIDLGYMNELQNFYKNSLFFRTLLENAMQSIAKSNFSLTSYLKNDPKYKEFWQLLVDEASLTEKTLRDVAGHNQLLANYPLERASIKIREEIVLPLLIIQQYALTRLREHELSESESEALHNLVLKSLAANSNASRNAA